MLLKYFFGTVETAYKKIISIIEGHVPYLKNDGIIYQLKIVLWANFLIFFKYLFFFFQIFKYFGRF